MSGTNGQHQQHQQDPPERLDDSNAAPLPSSEAIEAAADNPQQQAED